MISYCFLFSFLLTNVFFTIFWILFDPFLQFEDARADCSEKLGELDCVQCESLLFEPTTLEDGLTVCRPCVKKRRLVKPAEQAPQGFGSASNAAWES